MLRLAVLGGRALLGPDGPVGGAATRGKHLSLLALLARGGGTGVSRDRIALLLWPESEPERARHSVDQAIYTLRRALGADAIGVTGQCVVLNPEVISSDVGEFLDAAQRGAHAEAVAAYAGPFLDGFHLAGAPEWERWTDAERDRLHRLYTDALEKLARAAAAEGDPSAAVGWWRRLAAAEPISSRVALGLMNALEAAGDRAGALQFAGVHEALVRAELDTPPDPAVTELASRLRAAPAVPAAPPAPPSPPSEAHPPVESAPPAAPSAPRPRRARAVWALAASVCLVGAMALMVDGAPAPARTTPAPGARVEANPQTRSPAARSLYGEGLQAYYDGDGESAHRLFRAALREDTTFAVAALYVAQTARSNEERLAMLARAVQLAERSGNDHERLLALATRAAVMDDPSRLAVAETLSIRYPHEPDGELLMGQALLWSGEFAAAIPRLRRVVAMEGAGPRTPEARCRACDALSDIQTAYSHLDSTAATVRTGREWVERQPKSAKAWIGLASALAIGGRHPEALDAIRRALALHAAPADIQVFPAELRVWAGEFEIADGLLRGLLRDGSPGQRREAAWVLAISLRSQGRLKEALALSEQLAPETRSLVRALLYREMGRHRESAALWEHRARTGTAYPVPPSRRAREWAWASTHRADALAGLGDTAALRALAPEIRRVGALSAYGRDRRLHHHARGLLLARQGRPHEAAAEFRRAQFSPVFGNTRTNLELGQALIAAGRPAEAIPVLRAALRAGVTATALYTTPTELRRVLGTAYDAAGQPDSAAAQYRLVQRAYRQADPQFAPYIAGITRRLGSAD